MFAESLSDSTWANRSHRGWTALLSFGLQAIALAGLLALPLIYPEGIPRVRLMESFVTPSLPVARTSPPAHPPSTHAAPTSNMQGDSLLTPTRIPTSIQQVREDTLPPQLDLGSTLGLSNESSGGRSSLAGVVSSLSGTVLPPPVPHARRPPTSVVMEGNLIHRVQPIYPPLAKSAGIQGTVVLRAEISREGTIEKLQVVSGHPLLIAAARDAVAEWLYRPYMLNGEPIEVETQVTVKFILAGR